MTFVRIDPVLLQSLIDDLNAFSDDALNEHTTIKTTNANNDDPASLTGYLSSMETYRLNVEDIASDLQTRLDEAVAMSSQGITSMTDEGGTLYYSYYIPDDVQDTAENVALYNSKSVDAARQEAAALQEAYSSGTSSDGRTPDEILAQVEKHQDIPTYGAAFVATVGTEGLLTMTLDAASMDDGSMDAAITTLGHVYAAATQSEDVGEMLAQNACTVIDEAGEVPGMMTALNMLLTAPTAVYGTEFLVSLADQLEDRDPEGILPNNYVWNNGKTYTSDYLEGVLGAMENNPDAALRYFVPEKEDAGEPWAPSAEANERWQLLTGRSWDNGGIEGFTAGLAGLASKRSVSTEGSADDRATWGIAQGLVFLASDQAPRLYGEAKGNVGAILGACGQELTQMASGTPADITSSSKPYTEPSITTGGGDKDTIATAMATVLDDVAGDDTAANAIAQGMIVYAGSVIDAAIPTVTEDQEKLQLIENQYNAAGQVIGLVDALAQVHAEDSDQSFNRVSAGVTAATGVVGAVDPRLAIPTALLSGTFAVADTWYSPESTAVGVADLTGAAYASAIKHGLVSNLPAEKTAWYNPYASKDESIVNLESREAAEQFTSWTNDQSANDVVSSGFLEYAGQTGYRRWSGDNPSPETFRKDYGVKD